MLFTRSPSVLTRSTRWVCGDCRHRLVQTRGLHASRITRTPDVSGDRPNHGDTPIQTLSHQPSVTNSSSPNSLSSDTSSAETTPSKTPTSETPPTETSSDAPSIDTSSPETPFSGASSSETLSPGSAKDADDSRISPKKGTKIEGKDGLTLQEASEAKPVVRKVKNQTKAAKRAAKVKERKILRNGGKVKPEAVPKQAKSGAGKESNATRKPTVAEEIAMIKSLIKEEIGALHEIIRTGGATNSDAGPSIAEPMMDKASSLRQIVGQSSSSIAEAMGKRSPSTTATPGTNKSKSKDDGGVSAAAVEAWFKQRGGREKDDMINPEDLQLTPVAVEQPPVPCLEYGLDRVLFNSGVYQLQDPHSRVYNFDPYLQRIMPVTDFNFNSLKEYKTSSHDTALSDIATANSKRYIGSTSSMTSCLAHFHFLLSNFRDLNYSMLSRSIAATTAEFTKINKAPNAIFLRWKNGTYAIDADKEYDSPNVLMLLGKSMEILLTQSKETFERYRKDSAQPITPEEKAMPEAYHYTTLGDFLMRSQLDAYDPRLPGTGMFDLKTRAVVSIRMNVQNYEEMAGYEIKSLRGNWFSYEREFHDMLRSTMLKYSLQARMGRMDGIFVAYHNSDRIFGFQYLPISELDDGLHGQTDRCLGDQEFIGSVTLLNKVLDQATQKFPEQSLRLHFETRPGIGDAPATMHIFAEPMTEEEIDAIQNRPKEEISQYEREVMGLNRTESETDGAPSADPAEAVVDSEGEVSQSLEASENTTTESSELAQDGVDIEHSNAVTLEAEPSAVRPIELDQSEPEASQSNADTEHTIPSISEARDSYASATSQDAPSTTQTSAAKADESDAVSSSVAETSGIDANSIYEVSSAATEMSDTEIDANDTIEDNKSPGKFDADMDFIGHLTTSHEEEGTKHRQLYRASLAVINATRRKDDLDPAWKVCQHNRPRDLKPDHEWQIRYILHEETDDPALNWARYEDMKERRRQAFSKPEEDEEDVARKNYIDFLRRMSESGRRYRETMDKHDEGMYKVTL